MTLSMGKWQTASHLAPCSSCPTDPVHIVTRGDRQVVVYDQVDGGYVQAPACHVRCEQDRSAACKLPATSQPGSL